MVCDLKVPAGHKTGYCALFAEAEYPKLLIVPAVQYMPAGQGLSQNPELPTAFVKKPAGVVRHAADEV
jgi:hypothetical protein